VKQTYQPLCIHSDSDPVFPSSSPQLSDTRNPRLSSHECKAKRRKNTKREKTIKLTLQNPPICGILIPRTSLPIALSLIFEGFSAGFPRTYFELVNVSYFYFLDPYMMVLLIFNDIATRRSIFHSGLMINTNYLLHY
jgi:hypothetical protein